MNEKPRTWFIPSGVGGFYDGKEVSFAVGPIPEAHLPDPGGVWVIEYSAYEKLESALRVAEDTLERISFNCEIFSAPNERELLIQRCLDDSNDTLDRIREALGSES